MDMQELDFSNATAADLDNLSMDDLLGINIADVDLSSGLPDGVYIGYIEKMSKTAREAKPEENKSASVQVQLNLRVVKCIQCADSSVETDSLANRVHAQRFPMTIDMGKQNLAKLVLGIAGVSFRDKAAIAEVGKSLGELLNQMMSEKVVFGFTIKNVERGGFENCDVVFREPAFISAEKAIEYMD